MSNENNGNYVNYGNYENNWNEEKEYTLWIESKDLIWKFIQYVHETNDDYLTADESQIEFVEELLEKEEGLRDFLNRLNQDELDRIVVKLEEFIETLQAQRIHFNIDEVLIDSFLENLESLKEIVESFLTKEEEEENNNQTNTNSNKNNNDKNKNFVEPLNNNNTNNKSNNNGNNNNNKGNNNNNNGNNNFKPLPLSGGRRKAKKGTKKERKTNTKGKKSRKA